MFKFYLYKFGQFILKHISLHSAYRCGVFLSDLQYYFSFRDRKAVCNNLRNIGVSSENLKKTAQDVFRNFGRYLVEFFSNDLVTKDYINKHIRIDNLERISSILKEGKGGIIVTAHIGNWELGGIILEELGFSLTAIALPHKERPVNDLFNSQRTRKGLTIVPPSVAIRKCLEALKRNQLVALVADRDFGNHGEVLTFLGKKVLIPKGPAMFSLKTGAPIIPIFLIRENEENFHMIVENPIYPDSVKNLSEPEKLHALIYSYLKLIEKMIKLHPSQWLMFRQYWLNEPVTWG